MTNIKRWLEQNTASLQGQVVVITGATGGLGQAVVRYLVQSKAQVIMLGRNIQNMRDLSTQLREEFPEAKIETLAVDLNQIKSVNGVAAQLVNCQIDYLILNAGIYHVPLVTGQLGYNNVFQVNFISQYYLMKQLLPALQRTKGKVVAVSSLVHSSICLDENDIDYTKHAKAQPVYANSKRFLTLALSEFFKDRNDVRLAIVHPGVTLTPMTNYKNKKIVAAGMKLVLPKSSVAALNLIKGVFTEIKCDEWIGPKFLKIWGAPTVSKLPKATAEERAKIFNLAESIGKVIEKSNLF
ncbi:MAG: SDR family NAD(P)-dependent oxidoreductase [Clostridia bacterium]|nr:SDR family NAD(P)-dependent oxidoreductase [Clostridia bacterium]